ncbi:MAG TPA: S46 family peptidase [Opitutaceae bacterium]|nr:S46 family peptidase [Opitutaceae bacterium]
MKLAPLALAILVPSFLAPVRADEGMWLFSAPPREKIQAAYGFQLDDAWLNHLMRASVRFNSGGSGSFVSADGLVITNHHVGLDSLQKMSDAHKNYPRDGFYASTAAEEVKCLDLELNVLQSTEDVTARVNAAIPAGASSGDAAKARRRVFAEIEKESHDKTGLRSDVVTLYKGGAYHLYRYKRYTDVRLVFAPEQQAAFFGGDPDNFEYPRFDLDICIFRVYENGQPVHPEHFLKWSPPGARDGDLVFVSGHPGGTNRLLTVPELEFMRDTSIPYVLDLLKRREVLLMAWGARSDENARRAKDDFFGFQNSRKVYDGILAGLQGPAFMGAKEAAEENLKRQLSARPDGSEALAAYRKIAAAQRVIARDYLRFRMLERANGFYSDSFQIARELLRSGDEHPKPDGERLPEYSDARRESFELDLFSDKPIYTDFETICLGDSLTAFTEGLGFGDPTVEGVLAGKSPRDRAAELVLGTKVRDVAFRRQLYAGGAPAVAAAHDPMIELARLIDDESRALRKTYEAQDEIKQQAQAAIGKARFAVEGTSTYPDATFTLRLSYGAVRGYEENGAAVPSMTTIGGLYQRSEEHGNHEPFDLAPRWVGKKQALNLETPLNFVTTCDIIGGNSGSPTVNRKGEFVGIIFDGNIESLTEDLAYDDVQMRALSVHSAGILEALRKIYGVNALADELVNGHR